jgi:serine/threonine protein phosphatase PrpC
MVYTGNNNGALRRQNVLTKACYLSHTGKVRKNNEDSLLVNETLISRADMETPECLRWDGGKLMCIVADGMGGHRKGEVASRTVLDIFRTQREEIEGEEQIADVIRLARERLNSIAKSDRTGFGLGTTVSGLVIVKGRAVVFNCGDSRAYLHRGMSLNRITKDHSLVQRLVDEGMITEEEMRSHPQKNIVTSAIIGDMRADLPVFSVEEMAINEGDRFFLCTDGVWESLSRAEMERCLGKGGEEGIRCIVQKIFAAGARDNLSMIVVEIMGAAAG